MKFGTLMELQPGPIPADEDEARRREQQVWFEGAEQTVLTEQLGFQYVWAVEHHFLTGFSSSSAPECWLSWVAAKTSKIRLGHGVIQMSKPMNHVIRVAERLAGLDIVSQGRVEFGSGRGFAHEEVEAFGISPDDTRPMQLEAMQLLPELWNTDEFELDNLYYKMPRRRLAVKPVQKPHPPMWMATSQPDTWEIAGRLGAGVLAFGFAQPGLLEASMKVYRDAIAKATPPYGLKNDQIAFAPLFYCAPDEVDALETFAPHALFYLEKVYGFVQQWTSVDTKDYAWYKAVTTDVLKLPELSDSEKAGLSPGAQVVKAGVKGGLFCVGSPDSCREFTRHYDSLGIDQMILMAQLGTLTNQQIQDSLRLYAAEVMPEFAEPESAGSGGSLATAAR
jgi:alkanesulfonate monooxygenase SsuD/methylene tetrahydromethanopterin reductase-like flavin-dependent oxidoreductase (luciferase family)